MKISYILVALLALTFYVSAQTCANNPLVSLLQAKISAKESDVKDMEKKDEFVAAFTGYKSATAVIATDENLAYCKKALGTLKVGQKTCCTAKFLDGFLNMSKNKYKRRKDDKPPHLGLIKSLKKSLERCTNKNNIPDYASPDNKVFGEIWKKSLAGQRNTLLAQTRLQRGVLCGLCADPTDFEAYFESKTLRVTEGSFKQYETLAIEGLESNLSVWEEALGLVIQEVDIADPDNECPKIRERINKFFKSKDVIPCETKEKCKDQVHAYIGKPLDDGVVERLHGKDEQALDGNGEEPQAPPPPPPHPTTQRVRRLAETIGGYKVGDKGLAVYQEASSDDTIIKDIKELAATPAPTTSAMTIKAMGALVVVCLTALLF